MKDIEELIVYWLTAIYHDDPKILTDKKYAQKVKKNSNKELDALQISVLHNTEKDKRTQK